MVDYEDTECYFLRGEVDIIGYFEVFKNIYYADIFYEIYSVFIADLFLG